MSYKVKHLKIQLLDDLSHHRVEKDIYDHKGCHKGVIIKDKNGDNVFIRSDEYSVDEQDW